MIDSYILRAAVAVINAMETLDQEVAKANVGEIYADAIVHLKIDDTILGRIRYIDDIWQFEPVDS
jgi:hypothetical protein